jgi:hypothetical protein
VAGGAEDRGPGPLERALNRHPAILLGGGLAAIGAVAAILLIGLGRSDKDQPDGAGTPATATTGTARPRRDAAQGSDEADIRLGVKVTLDAVRRRKAQVFCGGLSSRYQRAEFGGPFECERAFRAGRLPGGLTPRRTGVARVAVEGDRATATLADGERLRLVRGRSFWEIDGVG